MMPILKLPRFDISLWAIIRSRHIKMTWFWFILFCCARILHFVRNNLLEIWSEMKKTFITRVKVKLLCKSCLEQKVFFFICFMIIGTTTRWITGNHVKLLTFPEHLSIPWGYICYSVFTSTKYLKIKTNWRLWFKFSLYVVLGVPSILFWPLYFQSVFDFRLQISALISSSF